MDAAANFERTGCRKCFSYILARSPFVGLEAEGRVGDSLEGAFMSIRFQIAALIFTMVNAEAFGIGIVPVL